MSTSTSIIAPVAKDIQAVEALIHSLMDGQNSELRAAIHLILSSGGKRIRPSISLLVGHMLGGPQDQLITLSAAIELLHTATLVHDDLIDSSPLRRGIVTLNARWSSGASVLTGDLLFAYAAQLAAEIGNVEVMKRFSQVLTFIVNGEITQLFTKRCQISREDYYKRIYAKTASLFETTAMSAAMLSSATPTVTEKMGCFGYNTGMAFQIIDDILDFTSQPTSLGKPVGSDLSQGLVTLPTIYFAESHPDHSEVKLLQAGKCPPDDEVQSLIAEIRSSNAIARAHEEAVSYVKQGIENLNDFPPTDERAALIALAEYIVQRDV